MHTQERPQPATRSLRRLQSRVIVSLGRFAMGFVLQQFGLPEQNETIGILHGRVLNVQASYGAVSMVPLCHPAAAFYDARLRTVFGDDFQVLRRFVAKELNGPVTWPLIAYGTTPLLIVQDLSLEELENTRAEMAAKEVKRH